MAHRSFIGLMAGAALFAASCNNNSGKSGQTNAADTSKPLPPVALASVTASPDYKDALLKLGEVKAEKVGKDSAKVSFTFDVKNYELKSQTADGATKMCNNSAQGQHIHFILDNKPYKALYEPHNDITLANGTEHYLIAFLSRSYHESVKTAGAAIVYHFKIDEKGNLKKMDEPKTPMLFYSRPKGEYIGKDTANVLLDFYVWNGTLATDGYKVKAEISNEDKPAQQLTTTIDTWAPNFIQNLGTGKCKVTLTLLNKDGQPAEGPNTSVTREFKLAASEGAK